MTYKFDPRGILDPIDAGAFVKDHGPWTLDRRLPSFHHWGNADFVFSMFAGADASLLLSLSTHEFLPSACRDAF